MSGITRYALVLVSIALSINILVIVRDSKTNNKVILAGIGTFPGGQSTGGYSEFDFEHPSSEAYNPRHTAQENVKLQRMGKRWKVVSGPCKGSSSVEDLRKCVTSKQPKWTDDYNVSPKRQGEEYALMKPASAGVDVNSRNPSLENVIRANKLPNLKPLYGKMKSLQNQLNVIKNPRNLDTEDLTSETSDDWLGQTANLCCANMYDTVCNQPCHTF